MSGELQIRLLQQGDIQLITAAFAKLGWDKPAAQYAHYLIEQETGDRVVLVAFMDSVFAGYITILWESPYPFFWKDGIPEIVDFNILPNYRRRGIGTQLMNEAERRIAVRAPIAGIWSRPGPVCQTWLYPRRERTRPGWETPGIRRAGHY